MYQKAHSFNSGQSSGDGADLARDGADHGDVRRVEVDVVGDKEFACTYRTRASRRMKSRTAKVWASRCLFAHGVAKTFELSAPHVFKVGSIRASCRALVEVDGYAETAPNFKAGLTCQHHALFQFDSGDWHERNHIGGTDSRMKALLICQVDEFGRHACAAYSGLNYRRRLTRDCDDRAVVICIHCPIKQAHTFNTHCGNDCLDAARISALREIWNAFN